MFKMSKRGVENCFGVNLDRYWGNVVVEAFPEAENTVTHSNSLKSKDGNSGWDYPVTFPINDERNIVSIECDHVQDSVMHVKSDLRVIIDVCNTGYTPRDERQLVEYLACNNYNYMVTDAGEEMSCEDWVEYISTGVCTLNSVMERFNRFGILCDNQWSVCRFLQSIDWDPEEDEYLFDAKKEWRRRYLL